MNRELQAGPELDALVAERVMGYRWVPVVPGEFIVPPDCTHVLQGEPIGDPEGVNMIRQIAERYEARETRYFSPTPYSTDIAAAWLIVEKMRLSLVCSEDGWYAILPTDIRWGCVRGTDFEEVALVGEEQKRWQAYPTAPEAICRAALNAATAKEQFA